MMRTTRKAPVVHGRLVTRHASRNHMKSLRKLAGFLRPYTRYIIIGPLLMLLLEMAMDLMQPRLMQRIVDVGIVRLDLSIVLTTGAMIVGLALIGMLAGAGNTILAGRASQGVGADLRSALFRKVQSLSFGMYYLGTNAQTGLYGL